MSEKKIFESRINNEITDDVKELVGDEVMGDDLNKVVEHIGLSTHKYELYINLIKEFGHEKGLTLYNSIKKNYARLKKK